MEYTTYKSKHMRFQVLTEEAFAQLKKFQKKNDQRAFNNTMETFLPGINRYIKKWLGRAVRSKLIPVGKYRVDDFVNELYIQTFDHLSELSNGQNLHSWLYKKADEILADTEIEEEFDNFFFENIDNYTKEEWAEMEEKYTTDADGDYVMEEELTDLSYSKNDYVLDDVFIENKDIEIIEKLSKQLNKEQINRHIEMALNGLSIPLNTIFELAVFERFTLDQIAHIKSITVQEVEQRLTTAKNFIRVSFEKRYNIFS